MTDVREVQITFDCADPGAQAEFWAAALGYQVQPPPPGFDDWDAALDAWGVPPEHRNDRSAAVPVEGESGPRLFFQKVPEEKVAKNRVHLDVRSAPGLAGADRMARLEEVADELVSLGAQRLARHEPGGIDAGHLMMADPEDNEFCLD